MGKPRHTSKWNKKFRKTFRKCQNRENKRHVGLDDQQPHPATVFSYIAALPSKVWVTLGYLLNCINFLLKFVTESMSSPFSSVRFATITLNLQGRVKFLENEIADWSRKFETLHQEFQLMKTDLEIQRQRSVPIHPTSYQLPPNNIPVPPPFPSMASAPPPPPPPPPPPGMICSQAKVLTKVATAEKKVTPKQKPSRPSISIEEILNVKLKKTPAVQRKEKVTALTPANELLPRISLEALRSVKLKKTSSPLRETSPNKAKSPKSKMGFRHVLRRTPISFSPGGTPKAQNYTSIVHSEPDEMTPVMTRALLKRFAAFNMSPEDNKENDMQFA